MIKTREVLLVLIFFIFMTSISFADSNVTSSEDTNIQNEITAIELDLEKSVRIALENNLEVIISNVELDKAKILFESEIKNIRDLERNIDLIFSRDPVTGYRLEDAAINKTLVKNGAMRRSVELNKNRAEWNVEITANRISYNVKKAYYDLLKGKKEFDITKESFDLSQKYYLDGNLKYRLGLISKQQLLGLQMNEQQASSSVIGAEHVYNLQLINFKKLIGIPFDTELILAELMEPNEYGEISLEDSIDKALFNNAGAKLSKESYELARLNLEAIKVKYPEITYRYQEELINLLKAELNLTNTQGLVEMGVRSAYLSLKTSEKQIATFELAVKQAEEALRITELSFQLGQNTANDVTQANINLMNAKKSLAQQIHAFNLALLDFEYSTGIGK